MESLLAGSLIFVALLGLVYRAYRMTKGGPVTDVLGQGVLALCLVLLALGNGIGWSQWLALGFAAVFTFVVMPVWVLGVLIPMRPTFIDYAFTVLYWAGLVTVGVAALLA